jgi:hypothetical protein
MSTFTTPAILELVGGKRYWRLYEDFEYHVGSYPSKGIICVKKGFKTDLASIPRIFLPFFDPLQPMYAKPAILHDWLYSMRSIGSRYTRKDADKVLLEAMAVLGAPKITRLIIYIAVRLFAGSHYRKRQIKSNM